MPSSLAPIAAALDAKSLVLVGRSRAARWLRAMLPRESALDGGTGDVRSCTEWTQALWSGLLLEGQDDRILLNRWQEEHLWTWALQEATSAGQSQLSESAARDLAPLARRAISKACEQRAQHRLAAEADTYDRQVMASAWALIQRRCTQERLLYSAQLEEALTLHIRSGTSLPLPVRIVLGGAWKTTPAQDDLFHSLALSGRAIERLPIQADSATGSFRCWMATEDETSSYEMAVRFAVEQVRLGRARHVAFIARHPASRRLELESLFRNYLAPELGYLTEDLSSAPWSFAFDPPATMLPMIAEAFEVLRWTVDPAPLATIRRLLRSGFFSAQDTAEARARLAESLSAQQLWRPSLSLGSFIKLGRASIAPTLLSSWIDLAAGVEAAASTGASRSITHWVSYTRQLLKLAGWPGTRPLSATEHRLMQQWEHLLDGVSTLQAMDVRTSFSSFLALLAREADRPREALFRVTPALQVLTPEEARDQLFDLGIVLDETCLTVHDALDPLLPLSMQLAISQKRASDISDESADPPEFIRCCRSVLIVRTADGDTPAAPPLWMLQGEFLQLEPETSLPLRPDAPQLSLEPVQEAAALPFLHTDQAFGGTQVLELQAACGFRAFASLRLRSTAPEQQELGIDARAAGNVLHDALRHFWTEVRSRSALAAMTEAQREQSLHEAVGAALASTADHDQWEMRYRTVLQRRYVRLLRLWLEEEVRRGPFEVMLQEQSRELTLGNLRLSLRLDRVDKVDDGLVFVDYKSSRDLAVSAWEGERPDAPQLPAYALTETTLPVRGIAFAQIRPAQKQRRWLGLADADGIFPKQGKAATIADFGQRMDDWRRELTALAEAFVSGDVRVHPKRYPHTCRYCAQRPLCRVDPITLEGAENAPREPGQDEHG